MTALESKTGAVRFVMGLAIVEGARREVLPVFIPCSLLTTLGWYGQIKKMKRDPLAQSQIFKEEKSPTLIQFKDEPLPDIELPLLVENIKEEYNDDTILLNIDDMLSEEAINRLSPVNSTPLEPMEASSFMTESLMQNIFADTIDPVF